MDFDIFVSPTYTRERERADLPIRKLHSVGRNLSSKVASAQNFFLEANQIYNPTILEIEFRTPNLEHLTYLWSVKGETIFAHINFVNKVNAKYAVWL